MSSILYILCTADNGKRCRYFIELQVPYTIDSKNGEVKAHLRECGKPVFLNMIIKKD